METVGKVYTHVLLSVGRGGLGCSAGLENPWSI